MFRLWSHITSPLYAQGTPVVQAGALLLSLSDIELSTREKDLRRGLIVISEAHQPLKNARLILRTSQMAHDANTPAANPIKLLPLSMNSHAEIARLNAGQIRIATASAAHFGRVNNVITSPPARA